MSPSDLALINFYLNSEDPQYSVVRLQISSPPLFLNLTSLLGGTIVTHDQAKQGTPFHIASARSNQRKLCDLSLTYVSMFNAV